MVTTTIIGIIILIILLYIVLKVFKKVASKLIGLIINSAIGLGALILLNLIGFDIPIVLTTILIAAILGVPGLISLVILDFAGLI